MATKKEYRTTVYIGIEDGKKIRKTVRANSKKELIDKVNQIKFNSQHYNNIYNKAIFGVWADKWLKECKLPLQLSVGTITEYNCAIKHLNRYFENDDLRDITLSNFQCMINDLSRENPNTKRPTAKKTLENIIKVASAIFRYAEANNIQGIPHYFKNVVVSKKSPQKKRRALTEFEQQMIIDTPHRCQLAAMIMMFAGIRRGELIPLMWSDIDLKNGYISITKSVEMQVNQSIVKDGGKTESAVRKVAIPPILINYLINYKKNAKIISLLVCTKVNGEIHTKSSFRRMWDSYLIELNIKYGYSDRDISKFSPKRLPMLIERFTPHYLRHTYATILYLQGVDAVSAKQYLGHSDIQTTINIYTDLSNNSLLSITDSYKNKLNNEYKIKTA